MFELIIPTIWDFADFYFRELIFLIIGVILAGKFVNVGLCFSLFIRQAFIARFSLDFAFAFLWFGLGRLHSTMKIIIVNMKVIKCERG